VQSRTTTKYYRKRKRLKEKIPSVNFKQMNAKLKNGNPERIIIIIIGDEQCDADTNIYWKIICHSAGNDLSAGKIKPTQN